MKVLRLKYAQPACAASEDEAWEKWSLPLGNGYFGASVFGRTGTERIQLTENSLANPMSAGGLNNFAEVFIDFGHEPVSGYERDLSLNDAVAHVRYAYGSARYSREYFVSYPDKVMAVGLGASMPGALGFTLRAEIPFIKDYGVKSGDGGGKSGSVEAAGDTVTLSGKMDFYGILFEAQLKVLHTGGRLTAAGGGLVMENADSAVILIALGTNYKMESRVFTEPDDKQKLAPYPHPHGAVAETMRLASQKTFDKLMTGHIQDYRRYFNRVQLDLGGEEPAATTDQLLEHYRNSRNGKAARYLEELYFQYGRYLLIASSREGASPANLQGTWNCHNDSPWSCGYWHNINVQMNYWPAFTTNLAEMFTAYADYNRAYLPLARRHADGYIRRMYPENYSEKAGDNGWTVGTAAWLYTIEGFSIHSGPGTGGLTAQLFWDYYDFTRDRRILEETCFPVIYEMAKFLSKTLEEEDGFLLVKYSASPEQQDPEDGCYCFTTGCGFDQQMVWETHKNTLAAAGILGVEDELTRRLRAQIGRLDPVQIGASGQIKEFREENEYGDIGEYHHRHISHLVGLYPGTLIRPDTPAWMDAAKVTLDKRGDQSTGWAMAHRLNLWARTGDGDRAHKLYADLLSGGTLPNLWDTHPPFQIDGNFGGTAGVAEMLLQSHAGYIDVLPALPGCWAVGSFDGLVARGNFHLSATWKNGRPVEITVEAKSGGVCRIRLPGGDFTVTGSDGRPMKSGRDGDIVTIDMENTRKVSIALRQTTGCG